MVQYYVMPSTYEERRYDLRAFDYLWTSVPNVPFVYRFDCELDFDLLKQSMCQALEKFPSLAGRIVKGSKKENPLEIALNEGMGAVLEFERREEDVSHDDETPTSTLGSSTCSNSENEEDIIGGRRSGRNFFISSFRSSNKKKKPNTLGDQWEPYFPSNQKPFVFPHEPLFDFGPLLSIKLTHVGNGTSMLGISFVHCVGDACSIIQFLQTLSYFCGLNNPHQNCPMPSDHPSPIQFSRAYQNVETKVLQKILKEQNPNKEMNTNTEFIKVLVKTVPTFISDRIIDISIKQQDIQGKKNHVMENLKKLNQHEKWVSTFEVLCAIILRTLSFADGKIDKFIPKQIVNRCAVNTRDRGVLCPKNYFGNGLHMHGLVLDRELLIGKQDWLTEMSCEIHEQLRDALKSPMKMDALSYCSEAGLQKGLMSSYFNRLKWTKIYSDNVMGENVSLCNSWTNFDWFSLDFGSNGVKPSEMYVSKRWSHRRYFLVFPRNPEKTELIVRVQLENERMEAFLDALKETINFETV